MSSITRRSPDLSSESSHDVERDSDEQTLLVSMHSAVMSNAQTAVLAHPILWMLAGLIVFLAATLFPPGLYSRLFAETSVMFLDPLSAGFTASCILMILAGLWCGLGGTFRAGTPRLLVGTDLDSKPLTATVLMLLLTGGNLLSCGLFVHNGGLRVIRDAIEGTGKMNVGMREMVEQTGGQLWLVAIVLSSMFAPLGYQLACSVRRTPWTRTLFVIFAVTYFVAAMLGSRRNYIARPLFGVLLVSLVWPPLRGLTRRGAMTIIAGAATFMLVVFAVLGILRRGLTETSEVWSDIIRYLITPYNTQSLILHDVIRMPGQGTPFYWTDWLWDFPLISNVFDLAGLRDYLMATKGTLGVRERLPILMDQGVGTVTSIPAFASSWLDMGWLGVLPFFPVGLVCGWCWKGFLRGSSVSIVLYPTIAYSFMEWRANMLFPSVLTSYALIVATLIVIGRWLEQPRQA